MPSLNIEGMTLADGVVETVISIAVKNVEGVVNVGVPSASGILSALQSKPATQGIDVAPTDDGTIAAGVHVEAQFGAILPELAEAIRQAVVDAVLTQVGLTVSSVDVYIDGIRFE